MIRVAIGSAKVLGLAKMTMNNLPTTAHIMTSGRCTYHCKFCTQAANSAADQKLLSRISWPEYEEGKVLDAIREKQHRFKRVCLQVVHSDGNESFLRIVKEIKDRCDIPLSVDLKADDMDTVRQTFKAGADVVGLPIDAANPQVYSKVKEGSFSSHLRLVREAAIEFKRKISTHIIIGLGESERDVCRLIMDLHGYGVTVGLFSFTPIKGTALELIKQPNIAHYRRIQLARFLITNDHSPDMRFDDKGRIRNYGYEFEVLLDKAGPSAFQTSGCPDCNRPYYNESPGKTMYNYPYVPSRLEYTKAFREALEGLENIESLERPRRYHG